MMPSAETRILTALLLQPMDVRALSQCLSIQPMTARTRVAGLRQSGELLVHSVIRTKGRPWIRYMLSRKGETWARELMA